MDLEPLSMRGNELAFIPPRSLNVSSAFQLFMMRPVTPTRPWAATVESAINSQM